MTTNLQDVAFGSTVEHLDVLFSTFDINRDGELQHLSDTRVLDVVADPTRGHDRDGWFMVCVENLPGERTWVQAPAQELTVSHGPDPWDIGVLPPMPVRSRVPFGDARVGDYVRIPAIAATGQNVGIPAVEGTLREVDRGLLEPDYEAHPDSDEHPVAVTIELPHNQLSDHHQERFETLVLTDRDPVELEETPLRPDGVLRSLRQVPPGTSVALTEAFEPVRPANFPAPSKMLNGTVKEIVPADPDYKDMLVYMVTEDGEEGWLKAPTRQKVTIFDLPGNTISVPAAPWDHTSPMPAAKVADQSLLSEVAPGTVVSGLAAYPLVAVVGTKNLKPELMDNALILDINPLGVDVDGKEMVILSISDGEHASVMLAEAAATVSREYVIEEWAKPSSVRLEPVSAAALLQGTNSSAVMARGLNDNGDPAVFYGNVFDVQPTDDGLRILPFRGRITPGSEWLENVSNDSLWQFVDTAKEEQSVVPAAYLKPNQTVVNDDGAKALVIANDPGRPGTRNVIVRVDGVGVNGALTVPDGKLFSVENELASLSPEAIRSEISSTVDIENMPDAYEQHFTKVIGMQDSYTPGMG